MYNPSKNVLEVRGLKIKRKHFVIKSLLRYDVSEDASNWDLGTSAEVLQLLAN